MYIYLENNYFIPLTEIIAVVDAKEFFKSETGKEFLLEKKRKVINLSNEKTTVVVTDDYIYTSSYTSRAIYSRGKEFFKLKMKAKFFLNMN